jgi:translation initiation factor 2B subunit (eIF-2B alpha/beta/delta family)
MNKKRFDKIVSDIREVRLQGAQSIAKKALFAYSLKPTKRSKKKLLSIRPTEPLLQNVFKNLKEDNYSEIYSSFKEAQDKINKFVSGIIKNKEIIFTHCHSSTVVQALIFSHKKGKKFEVYNTETRPLLQGRKTARELSKEGIKVTHFVDSALMVALTKKQGTKKVTRIFLGADAILKGGIINKIGSGMISKIASENKIPVYILANSWKYSSKKLKMEQRSFREIWIKNYRSKIKIKNPAFEFIPKKYVKAIICEKGVLSYSEFLKKIKH